MRKLAILLMLSLALIGYGCSDENPDTPAGGGPHPLDGSFLAGAAHGPVAKADLIFCQECHGEPGGVGSNPRFNKGIKSAGGVGCEGCHPVNAAHPADWAGPNATFHYSAGNIQKTCTLCHGTALDGVGAATGAVSCLNCHAEVTSFTLDCLACHGQPPGATETVDHFGVASVDSHDICVTCHGMKENPQAAGTFTSVSNYKLFDKATDTPGDHWNGKINMNSAVGYYQGQWGCSACHGIDPAHILSDSGLPVVQADYGSATVPHATDGSFRNPANHGRAAKGNDAASPNGLIDCQVCHGQPGTDNPRFNVDIISGSNAGCETCHAANTAHPSATPPDGILWYNSPIIHSGISASNQASNCVLCHDLPDGSGPASAAVGPACATCHIASPLTNQNCTSCHGQPPDSAGAVGNARPNRQGQHIRVGHAVLISDTPGLTCVRCHNGAGTETVNHFDGASPADVSIQHPDASDTVSAVTDATNTTCTGACHIVTNEFDFVFIHTGQTWY